MQDPIPPPKPEQFKVWITVDIWVDCTYCNSEYKFKQRELMHPERGKEIIDHFKFQHRECKER